MREFLNINAVEAPRGFSRSMRTVTLLCLLGILAVTPIAAVDRNCNFKQQLDPDTIYYSFNPAYPNYSIGKHACRWVATTSDSRRLRLTCPANDLPCSKNCADSAISVAIGKGVVHRHCGDEWFMEESFGNEMTIDFTSSETSKAKFLCQLQAIEPAEDNCQCGWKNPTRIVGGTETGINEFPMMAGLVDPNRGLLYCGATIISEHYVLTAAHCVANYNVNNLGVIVGEHDVSTGRETNATVLFRAAEIVMHPLYQPHDSTNDIALIKIAGKISYSMKVGPACLPILHASDSFAGSVATVLGWGLTDFGDAKSDTLQKANLNVISNKDCRQTFPQVNDNEICTYADDKDACQFDSGGPVLWRNPFTTRLVLMGMTSQGIGCASGTPGLNIKVGSHIGWIMEKIAGEKICIVE